MSFPELFAIAVALAMDAFAVSVCAERCIRDRSQVVDIPLDALSDAGPRLSLWGK